MNEFKFESCVVLDGTTSIEIVPSSPPFKKYAEEWMETYKIGKCKPTTISGYNSILNQYLYPEFGSLTMDQFTTKCIQNASDLNGATSHTFRHTLGTLLNDAGADVKTIQGILVQKDYKTTMDRCMSTR